MTRFGGKSWMMRESVVSLGLARRRGHLAGLVGPLAVLGKR